MPAAEPLEERQRAGGMSAALAANTDRDLGHGARPWAALFTDPRDFIIDPTEAATQI